MPNTPTQVSRALKLVHEIGKTLTEVTAFDLHGEFHDSMRIEKAGRYIGSIHVTSGKIQAYLYAKADGGKAK